MNLELKYHFDAAHRLETHQGLCKNVHGHRWDVEVRIEGALPDLSTGIIIDFGDIKKIINEFDHSIILKRCPENEQLIKVIEEMELRNIIIPFSPTAENISTMIHSNIVNYLTINEISYEKVKVSVWESPNAKIES